MSRMSPLNVRAAGALRGGRRDPRTAGPAAGGRRGAGGRIPTRRPPRGRASSASAGTTTAVRCRARRFVRSRAAVRELGRVGPSVGLLTSWRELVNYCGRLVGRYN